MNLSECILTLKNHEQRAACENALMECQSSSTKSYASANDHTVQCDEISTILCNSKFNMSKYLDIERMRNLILNIVMSLRSVLLFDLN